MFILIATKTVNKYHADFPNIPYNSFELTYLNTNEM